MLSKPTLFFIGAGCSKEFQLPLGAELKESIAKHLDIRFDEWGRNLVSGDAQIVQVLRQVSAADNKNNINHYLPSCRRIRSAQSLAVSIDNFIADHDDDPLLPELAKLAIAKEILDRERSTPLWIDLSKNKDEVNFGKMSETWLAALFSILQQGITKKNVESIFDNVRFIVFNYDRIVETFLQKSLIAYYGVSEEEASRIVSRIEIIHPYGFLGSPFWNSSEFCEFGGPSSSNKIRECHGRILTFSESVENRVKFTCGEYLEWADTVCFIGMAYHSQNLQFIDPIRTVGVRRLVTGSKGISSFDQPYVAAEIGALFLRPGGVDWTWDGSPAFSLVSQRRRFFQES